MFGRSRITLMRCMNAQTAPCHGSKFPSAAFSALSDVPVGRLAEIQRSPLLKLLHICNFFALLSGTLTFAAWLVWSIVQSE